MRNRLRAYSFRIHPRRRKPEGAVGRGLRLSVLIISLLLAACGAPSPGLPAPRLAATATSLPPSVTPLGPPPTPICGGVTPAPPQYFLDLSPDYAAHTAEVSQTLDVVNDSGEPWRDLALVVSANYKSGIFDLHTLTVDAYPAVYALDGVGLRIVLPAPLESGCRLSIGANYTLHLPGLDAAAFGWRGSLGWTARQTLLGLWYPTLVPYRAGVGWLARPPAEQGEYDTAEASNVKVRLEPAGEKTDLTIIASAPPEACPASEPPAAAGTGATCFELTNARHFALALSDQMQTATATAGQATIVSMFYPEHSTAGQAALRTARDAFALFSDRYGPVPYTWLAAVEADLTDGMEFSGLFFLGRPYYAEFDGSPQNYLTVIAAHETAHQWWYNLVGNDQATEPWLDEALATYSEEIYFETAYPKLVEWWWGFRVWQFLPEGGVGADIYAKPEFRPYVNAVYLNGAQFLHALRGEAGDEAFFQFLRAYAKRGAGRIVTAEDFWNTYAEFGDANGSEARRKYFGPGK